VYVHLLEGLFGALASSVANWQEQAVEEEDEEPQQRPRQRQRRDDPDSEADSDGTNADESRLDDAQRDETTEMQLIKKLVRYALACEFSRTPIRREGIRERGTVHTPPHGNRCQVEEEAYSWRSARFTREILQAGVCRGAVAAPVRLRHDYGRATNQGQGNYVSGREKKRYAGTTLPRRLVAVPIREKQWLWPSY